MDVQLKYLPPPRLIQVEEAILGKMLERKHMDILPRAYPEDFYDHKKMNLYRMIQDHYLEFSDISPAVIYDKAYNQGLFDNSELEAFRAVSMDESTDALIKELKDYRRKREQHSTLVKGLDMINHHDRTSRQVYDHIISKIGDWSSDMEMNARNLVEIEELINAGVIGKRLEIGDPVLDDLFQTVGSHYGTTEVCVAHPKHGKTTYACYRAAQYINAGLKGVYFTFEGNEEDIYYVINPMMRANRENLLVVDSAKTAEEVVSKIFQLKQTENIDFVVVDYIQRIGAAGVRYSEETPRIAQASMIITNAIKEQKVYGLILAQPRKLTDDRKGWKACPVTDDVYGSGQVFKDAYLVTAIFRPFLAPAGQHENARMRIWATISPRGEYVPQNSVYLKMLICRRGMLNTAPIQFLHTDEGLTRKEERYEYIDGWKQIS